MEDTFRKAKGGALLLKGEKKKKHKKHKKREHSADREDGSSKKPKKSSEDNFQKDMKNNGGWWNAEIYSHIVGPVALQFPNSAYIKALDTGKFMLGAPHGDGQGPEPEEILMAMRIGEGKISLKSGFDKYLRLDKSGKLVGVSDAVGAMEMFEPVWEHGKMAILGPNGRFMSVDDDDYIVFDKDKVGPMEIIKIRSNRIRDDMKKAEVPDELKGTMSEVETKFVKKFQKFQDHKLRVNRDGVTQLVDAKRAGNLHETLLDRREKMKSDRMCK